MDLILEFTTNFLKLLDAMSIYVIVGLFIAGILKQLIPDDFISSHLGKNSTMSVIKATIFGIPLPVCSCSVIPLAQGLKKEGASKGSIQSFLISTPITGVDSILATFSFFGIVFTIFRVVSSVVIAIIVGLIQNFFEKKEEAVIEKPKFQAFTPNSSFAVNPTFKAQEMKESESSCCSGSSCCSSSSKTKEGFSVKKAFSYGYGTLFSDMAKSLLIGLILGALFTTFIPQEYAKLLFDNQILTYFVILLFAIPLYTCATASLPIAAALMLQGMSAGAVFIFLTAGPATSAVTMSIVYKMLGRRSLIIYVSVIAILSLVFGFAFDFYFEHLELLSISNDVDETSLLKSLASLFMLILIVYHLYRIKFPKKGATCCS
ncbi:SO_0444 family Cu/Zn efflux transporter [Arcobacter sp.]|uniref:SO_0444 family Cu/Zn efflux transporter n=1 Tax=unclassified Arcobacter TaxID=2593671 RepID=UPI003B00D4C5